MSFTLSAAVLALLAACTGSAPDDVNGSGASSSGDESFTADTAISDEATAFCTDAQNAFADLESATNAADPAAIPALFAEASNRLNSIDAPQEISEPWGVLTDALDVAVANVQGLDLNTPEGQDAFVAEFTQLQTTATEAQAAVESYVTDQCNLTADPSISSVADAVAEAGVSQDLVDRLAQVASNTAYGISRGAPLSDEQAANFAFIQIETCRRIQAGQTTALEVVAQDVADGAARPDAETMSAFLVQTFCPAVD